MSRKRFRVASDHAEDIASGVTVAPGETCTGIDEKDPHDQRLIGEGRLVAVAAEKPTTADTKEEK